MKQTSIEWFSHEVFKILNYQLEGNLPAIIAGLNMMEAKYKAIEMHKQEMASNCSQPVTDNHALEISDEEIEKSMRTYNITDFGQMAAYITGAKWYREKLKNADKKS
jgi:hypothetical protein